MGMYDTVNARCPACGNLVEFQSKAGECDLGNYPTHIVPVAIAEDIDGEQETCPGCDRVVTLRSVVKVATIEMHATIG